MNVPEIERRTQTRQNAVGLQAVDGIVTQGLLIQRGTGTVSAIEYLKAHTIDAAVIQRVLSGTAIRAQDKLALQLLEDEVTA